MKLVIVAGVHCVQARVADWGGWWGLWRRWQKGSTNMQHVSVNKCAKVQTVSIADLICYANLLVVCCSARLVLGFLCD